MKNNASYPDISVILPVYNVEEYLEECFDSLLRQGNVKLEIIVIDDGSTDSSGEIADAYAEKYDNFAVYHIENGGLGHARNYAVGLSTGKYIFFMDTDDVLVDGTLENMMSMAEANSSELTICNVVRFNSNKVWSSALHKKIFDCVKYCTHITESNELIYDTTSWNKLILREFYLKNGFSFPENILYEDIPVTIPMHILANNVSVYNKVGYLWRFRDGATKSITQNTHELKNFYDRLKILDMLDRFFAENVKDEALIFAKQVKALKTDLNIFVSSCKNVDEATAKEIMHGINAYIEKNVSQAALESLPLISRQKYECVKNYDLDGLLAVFEYEKNFYYEAPVIENGDRLLVSLKDELFSTDDRDITDEMREYALRARIDSIERNKRQITVHAHAYKRRISIPEPDMQSIKVYLFNVLTGEKLELEVLPEITTRFTDSVGTVVNTETGEITKYDYNGIGFCFTVDIDNIIKSGCKDGEYVIAFDYQNKFFSCSAFLNDASERSLKKNQSCIISDNTIVRLNFSNTKETFFSLSSGNVLARCVSADNEYISYCVVPEVDELYAVSQNGKRIDFEKIDGSFRSPLTQFVKETEYSVFALGDSGVQPVISNTKKLKIFKCGKLNAVCSSLKTNTCSFMLCSNMTLAKELDSNETVLKIKTEASKQASKRVKDADSAQLTVKDAISGQNVIIAKSKCKAGKNGNILCSFKIDFSKNRTVKNFYSSSRIIYIQYKKENKVISEGPLYSKEYYKAKFSFETLTVKLQREKSGQLLLEIKTSYKENADTPLKRKLIKTVSYPEFLKEPINPKQIVFESMWGAKYSCNPRAIYEYIDKNYPEYECVWFFSDERMPITGKARRVRRFSEEYYHCLATAKYLINNVNFPDEYIKRDGQIMVQTMHGTPLKTFGLEITQEMTTQQKIDLFLKRVANWNYLIVQGKFMEGKSYDCFKYSGKILTTGYPRTDALLNTSNDKVKEIKKKLGLPKDKKIILYTPTWRIRNRFDMMLDIEKMKEHLSDEYVLLIRIHYFSSAGYKIPADNKFVFDVNKYSSVEDLYLISDILITDYSSVMFDYALLDKPMLFFTYDFDTYCGVLRGIYVDFKKEAPGPLLYTSDEVISTIENIDEEMKKCEDKIKLFKEKYLTYENDSSSKRVVKEAIRPSFIAHSAFMAKRKLGSAKRRLLKKIK